MNTITLRNTLPEVFAQRTDIQSDVWRQEVVFEKEKTYLVEANSGTGKSSLCSYICGYRQDYQGDIFFNKTNIHDLSIRQWVEQRKGHLALLWQELRLFPELTAMENVLIKNKLTGYQSRQTIDAWFEQLGISDKRDALVSRMSFGQQQRVAMIRALCQPFDFILVDEPISHLDDSNSRIMADMLMAEAHRQGAGIIATSIGKRIELQYDQHYKL